jgi:hypothetical protein
VNRILKQFGIWVALIAGSVIAGHELVPHHHHYDSVYTHEQNDDCETENETLPDSSSPSQHCHALNEIFVGKLNPNQSLVQFVPEFSGLRHSIFTSLISENGDLRLIPFSFQSAQPLYLLCTDSPLRAPPAIA